MKTKLIGLGILAAVIIAAAAYVFISNSQTVTEINGYVGGEKNRPAGRRGGTGYPAGQVSAGHRLRQGRFHPIWSPTTPRGGISYSPPIRRLWNCISRFMEDPVKSETSSSIHPSSCNPRSTVAQALVDSGLAVVTNGVYTVDMEKLTETIEARHNLGGNRPSPALRAVFPWAPPTRPNPIPAICSPGAFGQYPLRRRGGRKQSGGDPAPAAKYFSEAGVYGKLLLGFVRSVSEDRHGAPRL